MWKQTKTSRSWVLDGEKRRWPNACVYEIPPATLQLSSLWWSKLWDTKYRNSTHSLGCSPAPRMPHPHEPEKPLANKSQGNLHKTHTIHPCIYIYGKYTCRGMGKAIHLLPRIYEYHPKLRKMGDRRQKHRFFLWFPDRSAILGSWVEKITKLTYVTLKNLGELLEVGILSHWRWVWRSSSMVMCRFLDHE